MPGGVQDTIAAIFRKISVGIKLIFSLIKAARQTASSETTAQSANPRLRQKAN